MYGLKKKSRVYVNVCAQKPFVYAFILSVVRILSLNTMSVQKHKTIS